MPVSIQIVEGLFTIKVLKLDDHVGIYILYGSHEFVHEVLLDIDRNSLLAQTQVERVAEVALIVSARIQDDGQRLGGVNAGSCCVQGQFTDLRQRQSTAPRRSCTDGAKIELTEMPTPLTPRSPRPRIRDPSVTTQISGSGPGQLRSMVRMDLRCLIEM